VTGWLCLQVVKLLRWPRAFLAARREASIEKLVAMSPRQRVERAYRSRSITFLHIAWDAFGVGWCWGHRELLASAFFVALIVAWVAMIKWLDNPRIELCWKALEFKQQRERLFPESVPLVMN
jgi:hypothetical protein